ncbi:proline--tRNA ligase, partial [Candidatus Bathyarchaeota archaeon]
MLMEAEIMDYRYPVKGCGVWLPYGFKLRKLIFDILRELLDSTGHQEVLFPTLIPEDMLAKEAEHIRGFEEECFWVTHGGLKPLGTKLALRPTSETAFGPMFKLWIHSHADLPMKLYQIVNIFRYETKATRPLIRMREVLTFKEAHTCHATAEDAERQVREAIDIYKRFFDALGVPYLISRRPEWDKFAGAVYSIAFDMICPDGRVMQIGTVHNLGQNFAKAFEITYERPDGTHEFVWQTCYGISGRAVAAVMAAHGDDHGLVLPPRVAPVQVVVVPIPYKGKEEAVQEAAGQIGRLLREAGLRVEVDLRPDITPGEKFYYWERRGVPVRVEVGPRDVEKNQATLVRRDTLERMAVPMGQLVEAVKGLLDQLAEDLRKRAWAWMRERVKAVANVEEARAILEEHGG